MANNAHQVRLLLLIASACTIALLQTQLQTVLIALNTHLKVLGSLWSGPDYSSWDCTVCVRVFLGQGNVTLLPALQSGRSSPNVSSYFESAIDSWMLVRPQQYLVTVVVPFDPEVWPVLGLCNSSLNLAVLSLSTRGGTARYCVGLAGTASLV